MELLITKIFLNLFVRYFVVLFSVAVLGTGLNVFAFQQYFNIRAEEGEEEQSYGSPATMENGVPATMEPINYGAPATMDNASSTEASTVIDYGTPATMESITYGTPASMEPVSYETPVSAAVYGSPATMEPINYGAPASLVYGSPATIDYGVPATQEPSGAQASLTYGAPATMESVNYGSPASMESVLYGSPATMEPVSYGAPATMESVLYGAPATMEPIKYGTPTTISSITYETPTYTAERAPAQIYVSTPERVTVPVNHSLPSSTTIERIINPVQRVVNYSPHLFANPPRVAPEVAQRSVSPHLMANPSNVSTGGTSGSNQGSSSTSTSSTTTSSSYSGYTGNPAPATYWLAGQQPQVLANQDPPAPVPNVVYQYPNSVQAPPAAAISPTPTPVQVAVTTPPSASTYAAPKALPATGPEGVATFAILFTITSGVYFSKFRSVI